MTYELYKLPGNLVAFTGVRLEQDDRRLAFEFSLMDRGTGDYPAGFDFLAGWQDHGQGWGVADVRVDVPLPSESTNGSGDHAADLDLRSARDAILALAAHVAALVTQPVSNGF